MIVELGKKYRTVEGFTARILATDLSGDLCVVAAVGEGERQFIQRFTIQGKSYDDCDIYGLMPDDDEQYEMVLYINVYLGHGGGHYYSYHTSRDYADKYQSSTETERLAMVVVKEKYRIGDNIVYPLAKSGNP